MTMNQDSYTHYINHQHLHVDSQVHHGQPDHVHRPADAVQADVRRHRPHWKVSFFFKHDNSVA